MIFLRFVFSALNTQDNTYKTHSLDKISIGVFMHDIIKNFKLGDYNSEVVINKLKELGVETAEDLKKMDSISFQEVLYSGFWHNFHQFMNWEDD